jgi:hypothetical protein
VYFLATIRFLVFFSNIWISRKISILAVASEWLISNYLRVDIETVAIGIDSQVLRIQDIKIEKQ